MAVFAAALLLSAGLSVASAHQTLPESASGDYDCVIEPKLQVKLGSPDEGIIRELSVSRGDRVKKGDVIAVLDSDLQAVALEIAKLRAERDVDVLSSQARLKYRTSAARRFDELSKKRIVTTRSVEEADTERVLAEFSLKAARMERRMAQMEARNAEILLKRRTIRSPVDGVVVEVTMSPGEFAHKQSPLMTIAQIDPLNVEVFVPITQYGRIHVGMIGRVTPEQPIGGQYDARTEVVDRVFDAASSTFGVRLALVNPRFKLPAGLKCRVRFLLGTAKADIQREPKPEAAIRQEAINVETGKNEENGTRAAVGMTKPVEVEKPPTRPAVEAPSAPKMRVALQPVPPKTAKGAIETGKIEDTRAGAERMKVAKPKVPETRPSPRKTQAALVRQIQSELVRIGLNPGKVDGNFGALTREAIIAFERLNKFKVSGRPSRQLLDSLKATQSQAVDKLLESSAVSDKNRVGPGTGVQ